MNYKNVGFKNALSGTALCCAIIFSMFSCAQSAKYNEFDSGLFVVSTTAKSTGITIYDSLYVDRYSNDSVYIFDLELFGHLRDGKVDLPKQIKYAPYSAEYHCLGVINVLSSDSLYGSIELQSGDKRDTLILQFKRLSNRGSGQKFIKEGDGKSKRVLIYGIVDDTSSRFMFIHEALLIIEGNKLSGYFNVAAQGSVEYFLQGTKVNDEFVGEYVTFHSPRPTRSDATIGDFKLKFIDDYIELTGDFPFIFENRIKRTDDLVGFNYGASALFARPSLKSNELLSSVELVEKCRTGCEIAEIGSLVKTAEGKNLWYRVNVGDKCGWVLGGLQFDRDSSF